MEVINDILAYEKLKIYQNPSMFQFSLYSVLLPNFVTLNKNIKRILDIGTGNAIIPIILSTKTPAKITAVELQKEVYLLAEKSIKLNNLENQIELINDDIKNYYLNQETETFDVITCNPPYFKVNKDSHFNKSDYKTIARHEVALNLDDIMKIAVKLLKNKGIIAIVHRPERMIDIIKSMKKYNIEPKKIRFVHPNKNKEANIILIEGRKNGQPGIKVLNPIYSHEKNGKYTNEIQKYFK